MYKTIIVTGANGFVGHHLVNLLSKAGHKVIGIGQDTNIQESNKSPLSAYIQCDLTDYTAVTQNISFDGVDAVIHLAGLANIGQSFIQPTHFLNANIAMSVNILQAALESAASSRFIMVSTGAVYDNYQPMPLTENSKVAHNSPYAVAKLSIEMMNDYYMSRGMQIITARPFNHFGPGQTTGFIASDLYAKLRNLSQTNNTITVGNLHTGRDYTDVRDVAAAYMLLATSDATPEHAVYNVCSGKSRTGNDMLEAFTAALQLPIQPTITVDESLIRPHDPLNVIGDNSRLVKEFGWQPVISFEETVRSIVHQQ